MITVISLFDGMSCGQIALNRAGIKYDRYFASEVDKYAMQVTQHNYPDTIQIGDVSKVRVYVMSDHIVLRAADGTRYKIYGEVWLIGGSPCQGFSFAGKQVGASTKCNIEITKLEQYLELKDEGFAFEGQSYLFWEYIRIKNAIQPKVFLLENVMMAKKWKAMFDEAVGVEPKMINSSLVSAQNRKRLYWTNINRVRTPKDRGIVIADILEDEVDEKYYMSQKATYRVFNSDRSRAFTSDKKKIGTDGLYHIADIDIKGHDILKRVYAIEGKSPTCNTCSGGNREVKIVVNANNKHSISKSGTLLSSYHKKNGNENFGSDPFILNVIGVTPRVRKLTPAECERLQTVPDNYTEVVSNSQRYKMLGNGWTVDVAAHLFMSYVRWPF